MENKKGRHGEVVSEIRKCLKNREAIPFGLVLEYNKLLIGKKRFNEILSSSPILQKEHNAYEEKFKRILPHAAHEWYSGNMKTNEEGEKVIPDSGYQPIIDGVIEGLRGILEKKESNKKLEEAKEYLVNYIASPFCNDETQSVLSTILDYLNEPLDTADNSISKDSPFKIGNMLIREWKNGDIDYCEFSQHKNTNMFTTSNFYKFRNDKNVNRIQGYYSFSYELDMRFYALKFNWRKTTQTELDRLNKLLGKEESKDKYNRWWACNQSIKDWFTKGKKYQQIDDELGMIRVRDNQGHVHLITQIIHFFSEVDENYQNISFGEEPVEEKEVKVKVCTSENLWSDFLVDRETKVLLSNSGFFYKDIGFLSDFILCKIR